MNTTQFDVAVIGAGIVGASCAYHLAQRGLKVVVLEAFASHAEGSRPVLCVDPRAVG